MSLEQSKPQKEDIHAHPDLVDALNKVGWNRDTIDAAQTAADNRRYFRENPIPRDGDWMEAFFADNELVYESFEDVSMTRHIMIYDTRDKTRDQQRVTIEFADYLNGGKNAVIEKIVEAAKVLRPDLKSPSIETARAFYKMRQAS